MMRRIFFTFGMLQVAACGSADPEQILRDEVLNVGFIPYETPLEFAGTGTLVGGSPYEMQLIAPPQACFPDSISGISTDMRVVDNTELPMKSNAFQLSGDARIGLVDALGKGNSPLSIGLSFDQAQRVDFSYTRPKREYFNSIRLTEYYREQMPDICKDYLDKVGYIAEAIKVDEMRFKFYRSSGGAINLKTIDPQTLLEIGVGTDWQISNSYELVITTPKYIGYRMGRLTRSDNGVSLCRANKIDADGRYRFQCLDSFAEFLTAAVRSKHSPRFMVPLRDVRDLE
jgi:hypothetical protein